MRLERDHRECAHIHAMRRAWQRFGLAVGEPELRDIERRLVAGEYEWVADLQDMRVAYRAPYRGRVMIPVFNIRLWAICTFLPSEAWTLLRRRVN
jgi:hypothetical protein